MKKIVFILFIAGITFNANAQKTEPKSNFGRWATANTLTISDNKTKQDSLKINKTLTSGDYLIKSSNNVWIGIGCSILSGFLVYQGGKAKNPSDRDFLYGTAFAAGTAGFVSFPVMFSINLRKAGKQYKKEIKQAQ